MAYERVNGVWPENVPALTEGEAIAAVKKLWRWQTKKAWPKHWNKFRFVAGRKHTNLYRQPANINLAYRGCVDLGWKHLAHQLSHLIHNRINYGLPDHGPAHALVEREVIAEIVKRGWLEGKLKRPKKERAAPTPVERSSVRLKSVEDRLKRWETKRKRAETAIKKLSRQKRALERKVIPITVGGVQ